MKMTQEELFKRYTYSPSRDRIGGGGFGTVYKAYDNLLHREVAIKVSEVKTTADGTKTFSLKDEFEALVHVPKHPNIANYEEFYSFEMPNGIFDYAVMQYYPDGNLSNAIKQGLTAEQKEDIATQLLEGIDFLHKHKVVHRDLKPGNILIVKHGGKVIPLITDFGLSKAAGVVDGSVFSNSFGAGTPRYSSPEQLQGNPLRFNTDLWSYGAILYELFTGEQLFTAGSGAANTAQADMEIYNKIVNGNVQSLGKMPEKWRKVAERCLVVDPTKRAKDAADLFAIIKGDDDETVVTSESKTIPKTETINERGDKPQTNMQPSMKPPKTKGKKKWPWLVSTGIAVIAVVLFLLMSKGNYAMPFSEGLALAHIDGKMGFINKSGKMVIELKNVDMADSFAEGLAPVRDKKSNKWGYVDKTGKQIVSFQYSRADRFSENLAHVVTPDGEHFFIDKTGKRVISFPYDTSASRGFGVGSFHEGVAVVWCGWRSPSYFCIDKTGEIVLEFPQCDYVDVEGFHEGMAVARINDVLCFINKSGEQIMRFPQYDQVYSFSEGMACVGVANEKDQNGNYKVDNIKWGYIDKSGIQIIKPQYNYARDFSEGLACVETNGKKGYIDKTGNIVIPLKYNYAGDFSEGMACVEKKFFVDKTDNVVITL